MARPAQWIKICLKMQEENFLQSVILRGLDFCVVFLLFCTVKHPE